jgi:membrane protease YdiL (CAAX protease family)
VTDPARSFDGAAETPPPIPVAIPAPRPVARWRWWIHLIVVGSYPLLGLVGRSMSKAGPRGPVLSGRVAGLLFVCGIELLVFCVFFLVAWLVSRASREELLLTWRPGWWVVPLGAGYSLALRFALGVVAVVVLTVLAASHLISTEKIQEYVKVNRPDVESMVSVPALRHDPAYYWLTLTLVSFVVAGLREEMWRSGTLAAMRALWPRTFGSRMGQFAAMALIAVAFGAMHLRMGVLAAIGAGLLGFMLGLIIVLHKSIWPAVIAHGLFDATTFALLPWFLAEARHLQGP